MLSTCPEIHSLIHRHDLKPDSPITRAVRRTRIRPCGVCGLGRTRSARTQTAFREKRTNTQIYGQIPCIGAAATSADRHARPAWLTQEAATAAFFVTTSCGELTAVWLALGLRGAAGPVRATGPPMVGKDNPADGRRARRIAGVGLSSISLAERSRQALAWDNSRVVSTDRRSVALPVLPD